MAIDLPPAIPAQPTTSAQIEAYADGSASVIETTHQGFKVRVVGNRYLEQSLIEALFAKAKSPGHAINAMVQGYYQSGHLLVGVYYAISGSQVDVLVVHGYATAVEAPDTIAPFFKGIISDKDLTVAEYDRARVLANLQSERAGVDYSVSYRVDGDPAALALVFTPKDKEDHQRVSYNVNAGNQGNRFVGRYFGGAGTTVTTKGGLEASLNYLRAIPELGEANGAERFESGTLTLSKPFSFGLYGVELTYLEYEREFEAQQLVDQGVGGGLGGLIGGGILPPTLSNVTVDTNARTQTVALTGEQVLRSSPKHRLTIRQRLRYVDDQITSNFNEFELEENYSTALLGTTYYRFINLLGKSSRVDFGLQVEAGLDSDSGTFNSSTDPEDEGEVLIRNRSGEFVLGRANFGVEMALSTKTAFKWNVSGQYVNDEQVPQAQQYVLGGLNALPAYLPGVLVGDEGFYSRAELSFRTVDNDSVRLNPRIFVDHGEVSFANAEDGAGDKRSVSTGGVGLSLQLKKWGLFSEIVAAEGFDDKNVSQEFLEDAEVDFVWTLVKHF